MSVSAKLVAFSGTVAADDACTVSSVAEELLNLIKERNSKCKLLR